MRKILITGAAGFVGRHLTRRILETGDEVHAVDNLVPLGGGIDPDKGWPFFDPLDYASFHFYREDCRDFFARVSDDDFDCCFHLAAVVGGRLVIENNPLAVAEDLSIDAGYWRWAVKTRPGKTACFSSSAVYPVEFQRKSSYELLREDMIDFGRSIGMPDMTYGWAKLTCEYLARLAYQRHGLKSIVYRPFSGYGEDQDDAYPFPSICKRALANQGSSTLSVWGTGEQMRDFIHIEDCVAGILRTLPLIDDAEAVNLSTGIFTSFRQFARIAADLCGYSPEIVGLSDKPSGVFARAGETSKQKKLGFTPQIDLRSGIKRAIEYYSRDA
ncbi:MAG: NAD-dependent epimerase/dehydratase family protein, partial [Phycisphaerales bacterium]